MEVAAASGDAAAGVTMMFTGAYFDLPERQDADGKIRAELHLVAQAVCRETREAAYIGDIYSNRTVLVGRTEELSLVSAAQPVSMRQTVTGSAEQLGDAGEILAASATVGSVTVEGESVKTTVNIRAVIQQDTGEYTTARCRLGAEFTTDIPAGTELKNVTVTVADVYCGAAAGALDVRAVLQMEAVALTSRTVAAIADVQEDAEGWAAAPAAPSIWLVRLEQGADMWSVAKKYHSTVEAIAAANGERQSGLLLIPKAR